MIEKVKIEADESLAFGYFVKKLEDGRWSCVAYTLTLWGARRVARRVLSGVYSETLHNSEPVIGPR